MIFNILKPLWKKIAALRYLSLKLANCYCFSMEASNCRKSQCAQGRFQSVISNLANSLNHKVQFIIYEKKSFIKAMHFEITLLCCCSSCLQGFKVFRQSFIIPTAQRFVRTKSFPCNLD